jgi:hypothetical protein
MWGWFNKLCHGHFNSCEAEILKKIPLLRFLQEPVEELDDLYVRHPRGGFPGAFAFVIGQGAFAYWEDSERKWVLMSCGCDTVPPDVYTVGYDLDGGTGNVTDGNVYSAGDMVTIQNYS